MTETTSSGELRALSLSRPWAAAVLLAGKTVENRSWSTNWRGWLVLHSAQSTDPDAEDFIASRADWLPGLLATNAWRRLATVTGYVGVTELFGVHRDGDADCRGWAGGGRRCLWGAADAWHWELGMPLVLREPVAGPGRQGLWTPPAEAEAAVAARLAARPLTGAGSTS